MKLPCYALLVVPALSACALFSKSPTPDRLFVLTPPPVSAPALSAPLPLSVMIMRPDAAPGLDTSRIAIRQMPKEINYYLGSAWASVLPGVAQAFFVGAFARAGVFRTVVGDAEGVKTDLTLMINIEDCEVEGGSAPVAHVRLIVTLADSRSHAAMMSLLVEESIPAKANHMPELIDAFNGAFSKAARKIIPAVIQAVQDFPREEIQRP